MAAGPTIPTDPLEILTPDISRPEPFINKYYGGVIGASGLLCSTLFTNYVLKKPVFSSMQYHIAATIFGAVFGQHLDDKRRIYLAERDAVLRHYVQLHPDDFPATVRQKFSDILLPWKPIR